MPPSPPGHARFRPVPWALVVPATIGLLYAGAHLAWYRGTPLGQLPVLDEQENLEFAEAIARGGLPAEPFYRAPGYPLMLATLRAVGVPTNGLFSAALVLGVVLHAVNAGLVSRITLTWFNRAAGVIAGGLYALHPVFVHYTTQALDAVPALTLFLSGLGCLAPVLRTEAMESGEGRRPDSPHASYDVETDRRERAFTGSEKFRGLWPWAAAGMIWAMAGMVRPNYILLWATLPWLALSQRATRWRASSAALIAGGAVFALVALWQWQVSGEPRILPWQGPYNLWAANQPGAHGRYYVQKHTPPAALGAMNPARAEAMFLYHQETGATPPDVDALNAHWRKRFLNHVTAHPSAWLRQLGRKMYALLNNWEQYNNKTFAFHRERSPWLRWNFLCWGALFVTAIFGFTRLLRDARRTALSFGVIVVACVLSVLPFFVSARFRLPLAACAVILAGGACTQPRYFFTLPRRTAVAVGGMALLGALLTFSSFDRVTDRATYVEDHALLARAALTLGNTSVAWSESTAALALARSHPDAQLVAIAAGFNQLVRQELSAESERRWLEICLHFLSASNEEVRELRAIAAVALWRSGQRGAAMQEWRRLGSAPSALAARVLIGEIRAAQVDFSKLRPASWDQALVRLAAARHGLTPPGNVRSADPQRATEVAHRIFGSPAP